MLGHGKQGREGHGQQVWPWTHMRTARPQMGGTEADGRRKGGQEGEHNLEQRRRRECVMSLCCVPRQSRFATGWLAYCRVPCQALGEQRQRRPSASPGRASPGRWRLRLLPASQMSDRRRQRACQRQSSDAARQRLHRPLLRGSCMPARHVAARGLVAAQRAPQTLAASPTPGKPTRSRLHVGTGSIEGAHRRHQPVCR